MTQLVPLLNEMATLIAHLFLLPLRQVPSDEERSGGQYGGQA